MNASSSDRFAIVDENGWIIFENRQIDDTIQAQRFYTSLSFMANNSVKSEIDGHSVIVEAFDCPLIVQNYTLDADSNQVILEFNYQYRLNWTIQNFIDSTLKAFHTDEWDRIYGTTSNAIPFVFSKKAHGQFLDSLDEFDDESVVFQGQRVVLDTLWHNEAQLEGSTWWDKAYTGEIPTVSSPEHQKPSKVFDVNPGWNIETPSESLKDMLPRMKLPKSRVLMLGCGDSHDASVFAENGHRVTAVDISAHAIERSKKLYGHYENITWVESDLFKLPESFNGAFDLVYEYTCFCAINPQLRNSLVQTWSRCLHEQGQLMATFFCMYKRNGPPFGGTEWEYRERLKKRFQPLIWTRWRKSIPRRQGRELFVLAQKRKLS